MAGVAKRELSRGFSLNILAFVLLKQNLKRETK